MSTRVPESYDHVQSDRYHAGSPVFQCATLKNWEWPGDEASKGAQCQVIAIARVAACK